MLYDLAITLFIHYALRVLLGPTSEQEGGSFLHSVRVGHVAQPQTICRGLLERLAALVHRHVDRDALLVVEHV